MPSGHLYFLPGKERLRRMTAPVERFAFVSPYTGTPMGGMGVNTTRQIYAGTICCQCHEPLPERNDGRSGTRLCGQCVEKSRHTVFLTFVHREVWIVRFLEADARTSLRWEGRFSSTDPILEIIRKSCEAYEAEREFENCVRHWGQGSVTLLLNDEQYQRLKRANPRCR